MKLRYLLAPFAGIWWLITQMRNFLYHVGILKSVAFPKAVICVGNLSTGGTGKSPHAIYILDLLRNHFQVAALSRGYGRQTKGFLIANYDSTASQIGDEPMQFFMRFKNSIVVAVGENRVQAIKSLLERFKLDAIVLDDAFQHRRLKPGFSVLLTPYHRRYTQNYLLPMGDLRESRSGAKRAQAIVVTKCPQDLSQEKKEKIRQELKPTPQQKVFFSSIGYAHELSHVRYPMNLEEVASANVLAITGIAYAEPFIQHLQQKFVAVTHMAYADHHNFTAKEIQNISDAFDRLPEPKLMVTTEKDYMRLKHEYALLDNLYYLPMHIKIDDQETFNQMILQYVSKSKNRR